MKITSVLVFGRPWIGMVTLATLATVASCSSDGSELPARGTGGGSAGIRGTGGAGGRGGMSSGGANAGGNAGRAAGGDGGGGRAGGTGGANQVSDGGNSDVGSDGGTDARPVQTLASFNEPDNLQGFALNPFSDINNLGDPARVGGVQTVLTWDGTEGHPDRGALKLTVPYSESGQFAVVNFDFSEIDLRDWTGRKLHVSVKIAGGFPEGGAVKVFVQNQVAAVDGGETTYPYADQYHTPISGTDWQEFTFDVDSATYRGPEWDATSITQVRWFGINFHSGTAPLDADAGTATTATFYIDNIWLE